jgi:ribosome modulation factor
VRLAKAHERGVDAKANGQLRRAVPADLRGEAQEAERDAWLTGWDGNGLKAEG